MYSYMSEQFDGTGDVYHGSMLSHINIVLTIHVDREMEQGQRFGVRLVVC